MSYVSVQSRRALGLATLNLSASVSTSASTSTSTGYRDMQGKAVTCDARMNCRNAAGVPQTCSTTTHQCAPKLTVSIAPQVAPAPAPVRPKVIAITKPTTTTPRPTVVAVAKPATTTTTTRPTVQEIAKPAATTAPLATVVAVPSTVVPAPAVQAAAGFSKTKLLLIGGGALVLAYVAYRMSQKGARA